ncbi:hypothetical protein pEaSNUABM8_00143 [Erwinia phage pEa_SNUABM_8]|nr:hypothetical protein pEaSNUABM8_00143 [Erwinia phage pEa_SNUABM_8]QVW54895.1 hypothetical protein pEaSNUABM4_00142 [Erwinia phage pEa_SNUABM_4]
MVAFYWIVLVVSALFTGMKGAQLQHCLKRRKRLGVDGKQQLIGVSIAFIIGAGLLTWSLYHIWQL